jgi:predicted CXXCH cytochrome family protein
MKTRNLTARRVSFACLILAAALTWALRSPGVARADDYADSAHGNTCYGVCRSDAGYARGDCANCHDPFDASTCDVNYRNLCAPYNMNFCCNCHDNTTTYAETPIVNRSYSYRAGAWTDDSVNDILEAFTARTSWHNLGDIKTFIGTPGEEKWGYTVNSNPCTACHHRHKAQGDPANSPDAVKDPNMRGFLVSRPSEHDTAGWGIWGDDLAERMSAYTSNYQAPLRFNATAVYEPDGSSTITDGSNLTDFNTLCTDCHNTTYTIYSAELGRDLIQIDWDNEIHGKGNADGSLCGDAPYPNGSSGLGKVLSCLDCHEPHGSANVALIRQEVNGDALTANIDTMPPQVPPEYCNDIYDPEEFYHKEFTALCNRCHNSDQDIDGGCPSDTWYNIHHGDTQQPPNPCTTEHPYGKLLCGTNCHASASGHDWTCTNAFVGPIECKCCHYHGSIRDDCDYEPYTRRTF